MSNDNVTNKEEKNKIHDNILDIMGRQFEMEHEKGISEWIKNSVDAYIRKKTPDKDQNIILRFRKHKEGHIIECLDFAGMTSNDIEEAFQRWGDPEAAKRGGKIQVYGGHGNGGKFYMRQMFKESSFITYKDGVLNHFGFSTNKKYGYAEVDGRLMKNIKMSPGKVIEYAEIKNIISDELTKKIIKKENGFTLIRGVGASGPKPKNWASKVCGKLKNYPQARRIISRINLSVFQNNEMFSERLLPDVLQPKKGFEESIEIEIPEKITLNNGDEAKEILMRNDKHKTGKLILKSSDVALERSGRYADLNRVDIIGKLGVIASYKISELPPTTSTQTVFIHGECECPILEDPNNSSVTNDREKLILNDRSKALLQWISEQIKNFADKMEEFEKAEQDEANKKLSSTFNDFLNKWKNNFMNQVFSQILVSPGKGLGVGLDTGGGIDLGGESQFGDDFSKDQGNMSDEEKNGDSNSDNNSGGLGSESDSEGDNINKGHEDGGGNTPKKANKFPTVKLSDFDDDPLNPGQKVTLSSRQPVVYQRPQDVDAGVYWINTSSPLAAAILEKYGAEDLRWRDYLLQRYIDIFIKLALQKMEKNTPDRFTSDSVDAEIFGDFVSKIHQAAAQDLESFLFEEAYRPKQ